MRCWSALWAWGLLALPALCAAGPVLDLPQYPEIDRAALERYAGRTLDRRESQARAAGELGCVRYCAMMQRAFARVTAAARAQGELPGGPVRWQLVVTTTRGEAALSLPGGHVLVSEDMIAELHLSEAELAFIIAHESAHLLLQHEAQALDFLQATLLPRGLHRTVWDLYAELDYDAGALLRLQGLMQQSELDADYAGLLLGAQAGYPPASMVSALSKIAASEQKRAGIVQTHPAMAQRLAQIKKALPMAERLHDVSLAGH
ncbi:MAG TPA: M48 family metalloprotease [Burkholderiales bacterium]|nr:M48 family metalloprotease [Burkholderiales bacterium]